MDYFIRPVEHYRRRVDLIRDYVTDATRYVAMMSGKSLEEVRPFIVHAITKGNRQLKIPQTAFLKRLKNGDREIQTVPFNVYLNQAIQGNEILAPTLTGYLPSSEKKSLLAIYIEGNLNRRSQAKKAMFQAETDNLKNLYATLKSQQETFKIKNNSLSGAQCSPFTPMWNKTGHSTLTSLCRTATSYANANNEKFLYGNRHYYSPQIVKTNLISIIGHTDLTAIEEVIVRFGLVYPTVNDCMRCIKRSTEMYWRNDREMQIILALVEKLSPVERAAFLYVSDLYHLAQLNGDFVRCFLDQMTAKPTEPLPLEEATAFVKTMDDNLSAYISILCAVELRGKDIKDTRKRAEAGEGTGLFDFGIIGAAAKHKSEVISAYAPLISALWVTDNLPSSIFALPSVVRRAVLTSDTDSTIFTTQGWVKWHRGKIDFSPESIATCNAMVYLVSQLVRHILATLCGNIGIESKEMFRLAMKNEFFFPVFALTSRAKHYFAYIAAQEGLVREKMKSEIKGVGLRSSAVATNIIKLSHQMMFDIMDAVMRGDQISILHYVRKVATIEREVLVAVENGSFEYFKRDRINPADAYKNAENSKYLHYDLWQKVFAPKYGPAPEPPYSAIKASLRTDRRGVFKEWLDSIEDRDIAERLEQWAKDNNKLYIGTIYMPTINLIAKGVPKEIAQAVNTRSLLAQLMESFYLVLETLGVYARNKKITRLLSDDRSIHSLPEGVLTKTAT